MRRTIIAFTLLSLTGITSSASGESALPYTDMSSAVPSYLAVSTLYGAGIVRDDTPHTYRPDDSATRADVVSIALGSTCDRCLDPSLADLQWTTLPYTDLSVNDPAYACILHAYDSGLLTQNIISSCSIAGGWCPTGLISRIDAIRLLLMRAGLWTPSSVAPDTSVRIADIAAGDYSLARRAIDLGFIIPDANSKIYPSNPLTRWDLAMMGARLSALSVCPAPSRPTGSSTGSYHAGLLTITFDSQKTPTVGQTSTYSATVSGGTPPYSWSWDYGDGSYSYDAKGQHVYTATGSYRVEVHVRDAVSQPALAGEIVDVVSDDDMDGDGIPDSIDLCPLVRGPASSHGCPVVLGEIPETTDIQTKDFSGIVGGDACMLGRVIQTGLILADLSVCRSCPCTEIFSLVGSVRPCDIIFGAVLSRTDHSIVSRGSIYQVH